MLYAHFDDSKNLVGFYDSNINDQIPLNAVEISVELHREFLQNQGLKTIDFETLQLIDKPIDQIKIKTQQDINTLLVEFNKFPRGVQRQFNDLKNYVVLDISQNNYVDALETIQTWLLPQEAEEYRQQFISLLQSIM
jgi:hypothetical protein